ncbi:hypothetical protein [Acetivibrio saccincola]|uniref:hypothetical protein n=1 Tax=Acetivibrio saccincola TaxID=1677857 RepID=UPI001F28D972|nr:hypothetical protein [Acetivibrio saccincola]
MLLGAYDYLEKPVSIEKLCNLLKNAYEALKKKAAGKGKKQKIKRKAGAEIFLYQGRKYYTIY